MNKVLPYTDADRARFWSLVERRDGECWIWRGAAHHDGRGRFMLRGKNVIASRVAWAIANNREPSLHVLHRCDNPPCCNPAHLWLGTMRDNALDMLAKGRHGTKLTTHCSRGHPFSADCYFRPDGYRECRICRREVRKALRQKRAAR